MSIQKAFYIFGSIVLCETWLTAKVVRWEGPDTVWVGFPGVAADQNAFLRKYYTDFVSFDTAEWVLSESADLVNPYMTQVIQFPEIITPHKCSWFGRWWNSWRRKRVWARQTGTCIRQFSPASYSIASYGVDRSRVNMGQEADVACVHQQLLHLISYPICQQSTIKTVWLAYSRGVSVVLRYIYGASDEELQCLPDAIILEGGLDVMQHFLQHIFDPYFPTCVTRCQKPQWLISALLYVFKYAYAPQYRDEVWDGIMNAIARRVAQKIPHDIPILLVASQADELVSYRLMIRLYHEFRCERMKTGHTNVHFLLLNNARHSYYVDGVHNKEDRDTYEQCVHAFYKKYGCAYDAGLAYQGSMIFQKTNTMDPRSLLRDTGCPFCCRDASLLYFYAEHSIDEKRSV